MTSFMSLLNIQITPGQKMKALISLRIKEGKEAIAKEIDEFPEKYIEKFQKKRRQLIKKGTRKVLFQPILQQSHPKKTVRPN